MSPVPNRRNAYRDAVPVASSWQPWGSGQVGRGGAGMPTKGRRMIRLLQYHRTYREYLCSNGEVVRNPLARWRGLRCYAEAGGS